MIKHLQELIEQARDIENLRMAVVVSEDLQTLSACKEAFEKELVVPVLIGKRQVIEQELEKLAWTSGKDLIFDAQCEQEALTIALSLIRDGKAHLLMKGAIETGVLLKAVLQEDQLRGAGLLSHLMIYEVPSYSRLLGSTDGGMNIAPTLEQKIQITKNAYEAFVALGYEKVHVALLAAKEKVSPKMPATVDANEVARVLRSEELVIEGPLALDLALSAEAAKRKSFDSSVAGQCDLLVVPTIEVGNVLGKSMTYLAGAESAGIILGADCPIVLTSRADSSETKLYSIALGVCIAKAKRR